MSDFRPTVVRLLTNIASTREIQLYLKRFSQVDAVRFAVVKVDGSVLRDQLDDLASSLGFLQEVGLTPILVHGAGSRLDEELLAAGLEIRRVDGVRFTSRDALAIVRRGVLRENLRLVEAMQAGGVRATSIHSGVFECDYLGRRKYGLVGKVVQVETSGIRAAIEGGSIPVIAALGETGGGQILSLSADRATSELVKKLQPYKIIFLTETGGLPDERGQVIDSISLRTDFPDLVRQPWLESGMRAELQEIHDLLMELPPSSSLSITRPEEIAKELFTHRGSGTLVRRGERIRRAGSWNGVDRERLTSLVESSFGRRLAEDYFQRVRPYRIYLSEHYRAVIVLVQEEGLTYMDKFAVSEEAQGEGLGRSVWQTMRAETPTLFWRSRRGNPANDFYFAEADGAVKDWEWTVFWYGVEEWASIGAAVEQVRGRPITVAPPGGTTEGGNAGPTPPGTPG